MLTVLEFLEFLELFWNFFGTGNVLEKSHFFRLVLELFLNSEFLTSDFLGYNISGFPLFGSPICEKILFQFCPIICHEYPSMFLKNVKMFLNCSGIFKKNSVGNHVNSWYYSANEFKYTKYINSFNILHSNLNGLESKFEEYHNFIRNTQMGIDILCISETSLKEDPSFDLNLSIDGYRKPTYVGSISIYSKIDINVVDRNDLNTADTSFEAVWIEMKNEKHKNTVCGCLRHPSSDMEIFINYLSKTLAKINKENKECYISGDINIDLLKYDTNNKYSEFLNTVTSFGFLLHILQPTRITEYSSTIIDNIYGNNFQHKSQSLLTTSHNSYPPAKKLPK